MRLRPRCRIIIGVPIPDAIVIAGPTASGKTALAIATAQALDTEIVSADSMQFYRGLEIGSGQPATAELARVKHNFVGSLDPSEVMSAGRFAEEARKVVRRLNLRGKSAVAVGGSGLYIRALIDGLFSGPGRDEAVRARLAAEAEEVGVAELFARLQDVDPSYASTIHDNDLRRIVRALEGYEITGRPFSELHETEAPGETLNAVQFALDWPRDQLYERINRRVEVMLASGWIDETRRLLDEGRGPDLERLRPLGYPEIVAHVRGELDIETLTAAIQMQTRRLAKRQLSWFRGDERIHWISVTEYPSAEAQRDYVLDRIRLIMR
ncbi:MAG: tRNA (adenosine(37)-N6)-dimethylallyltransferase MiaA [Candidatus Hydrogenedentota bacterium]